MMTKPNARKGKPNGATHRAERIRRSKSLNGWYSKGRDAVAKRQEPAPEFKAAFYK